MSMDDFSENRQIIVKVRLDFMGQAKAARLFTRSKPVDRMAEDMREQQVALLRNIPIQGVSIEDIDMSAEVYIVWDDAENKEIAYAPVTLILKVDNMEDLMQFIAREDFRTIEIIEPAQIVLARQQLERMLFKMHDAFKNQAVFLERRYNLR